MNSAEINMVREKDSMTRKHYINDGASEAADGGRTESLSRWKYGTAKPPLLKIWEKRR